MNKPLSLPGLLLKTVYFSPIANPLYPILGVALIVLTITGDLTKHLVLFAMMVAGFSGIFIGPFLCVRDNDGRYHLNPSILLWPIEFKTLAQKSVVSSLFYGSIVAAVLLGFMTIGLKLPHVNHLAVKVVDMPGKAPLTIATGIVYDLSGRASIEYQKVIEPSLVFGIVRSAKGWPIFPLWPVWFFLFFTASTAYFSTATAFKPLTQRRPLLRQTHLFLTALYFIITLLVIGDIVLNPDLLWQWRTALDQKIFLLPFAALAATALYSGGVLIQYRVCRAGVKGAAG